MIGLSDQRATHLGFGRALLCVVIAIVMLLYAAGAPAFAHGPDADHAAAQTQVDGAIEAGSPMAEGLESCRGSCSTAIAPQLPPTPPASAGMRVAPCGVIIARDSLVEPPRKPPKRHS